MLGKKISPFFPQEYVKPCPDFGEGKVSFNHKFYELGKLNFNIFLSDQREYSLAEF